MDKSTQISQPLLKSAFKSYPPSPIHIATAGVAIGVINAVWQADATHMTSPIGAAPRDWHVKRQIGMNTACTERFNINWVIRNGITKNSAPRR